MRQCALWFTEGVVAMPYYEEDPNGYCGILFEMPHLGKEWHMYGNWEQLIELNELIRQMRLVQEEFYKQRGWGLGLWNQSPQGSDRVCKQFWLRFGKPLRNGEFILDRRVVPGVGGGA